MVGAGRAAGLFLHELLRAARHLPQIDLVWDELWAVCYRLLEHGFGVNTALVKAELEPLQARTLGEPEGAPPPAELLMVVDANSIARHLRFQSLDLPGFLRARLGMSRRIDGLLFGAPSLPPHSRLQAQLLGFTWIESAAVTPQVVEEQLRQGRYQELWYCCGTAEDAGELLPWVRPPSGVLLPIAPSRGEVLPPPWRLAGVEGSLHPWRRVGWPGLHDLEVPHHVR